jgi:hypothetical protein
VANATKTFSPSMKCGHCGNHAPMEKVSTYSAVREHGGRGEPPWEAGHVYDMLLCPACDHVTLTSYHWHDDMEPDDVEIAVLYPKDDADPAGLPTEVKKAYEAAKRVRNVDANAFGVLLGRVLEMVCRDRNAQGRNLNDQLRDLAGKGEIPAKLVDVANGLRGLRNIGAHAGIGELTDAEVPILGDLARAILEYVYSAPLLAQKAEERLGRLRVT